MTIRRQSQTILASAARTATVVSQVFNISEALASTFVIDVTATSATPSIVVVIEGKDTVSGSFYAILTDAAITTVSRTTLRVGSTIAAVTNVAANDILPSEYRVTVTHGDGDSITYSIGVTHMVDN